MPSLTHDQIARLRASHSLTKPRFGAACTQCGFCCQEVLCDLGKLTFGRLGGPCPALTYTQGRFWCGLVLEEQAANREIGGEPQTYYAEWVGIGRGCDTLDRR